MGQTYVNPDSLLARTARETLAAHAGGAGPTDTMTICPVCGEPLPCPSGRAAAEVLFAAGLAESSGLIEAARQGLGPRPGETSPLGLAEQAGVGPSFTEQLLRVRGLERERAADPAPSDPAPAEPDQIGRAHV